MKGFFCGLRLFCRGLRKAGGRLDAFCLALIGLKCIGGRLRTFGNLNDGIFEWISLILLLEFLWVVEDFKVFGC